MSSKRKWDDAPVDSPAKAAKTDDTKTASEAAAAAAAIAAKIAAQFAGGASGLGGDMKDPHDADFTFDIDINDVRNRYMLTKGSTQTDVSPSFLIHPCSFLCTIFRDVRGGR